MDLFPAEVNTLKEMIRDWIAHPERELESTFGPKGEVDTTTFLNIVQRLKAKGYEPLPQEDKLNILTPAGVRFSIHGMGVIQQFCRDEIIAGKPYTAIIKDKASGESKLDLDDYDVRIKVRREIPLANDDPQVKEILARWQTNQKKAFRMIRRWTFRGQGIRFDLSMIRSTSKNIKGEYRWTTAFNTEKFLENAPTYEIEAELIRDEGLTPEIALKNLIRGVGEVLRGIQKNILLTRKSVRVGVIAEYNKLAATPKFRGVAPRTLQVKNMTMEREPKVPNIRDGYNVTDKADGLRVMAFCDEKGELWMIDMGLNIYRTGLKKVACANTLLDGEWVTQDKTGRPIQQLLLFDIYIGLGGKKVTQLPFIFAESGKENDGRHGAMEAWLAAWDPTEMKVAKGLTIETSLKVAKKTFLFGSAGDLSIFEAADRCLGIERIYHTDGLIFTSNSEPIPEYAGSTFNQQFKWKPSEENTIDFLVVTEKEVDNPRVDKISIGVKPETGETIRYKTLRLFVGSSRNTVYDDPRATILNELPLPAGPEQKGDYKPAIFIPENYSDTMASVCYCEVNTDPDTEEEFIKTERSKEPVQDRSIVEMAYEPGNDPGWRWIPLRVRYDKTERLQRGTIERTLNSEKVANDNWNSIYDPVTESMIRTGSEEPTEEEIAGLLKAAKGRVDLERKYYDRKAEKNDMLLVRGLQDFHNKWVKERILIQTTVAGGGKALLDMACGKAGDLQKWRRSGVDFVLGVDYAGENIRDSKNGAYARVLSTWKTNGKENVPPMIFAIGNSSKPLVNGEAGSTAEEQRILRTIFRRFPAGGDVPIYVERVGGGRLKYGADVVACMFAIHYFFITEDAFTGFLENIRETLKVGGYFIGCAFDGEAVFNLLRDIPKGDTKVGKDGDAVIWTLAKQYDNDDLPVGDEGFGMGIDVNFISIGTSHREYLVPFPLLVAKMKMIGCELLDDGELAELGLNASTNMFDKSYEMALKAKQKYPMSDAVKRFSFLNRWFIFKRKSDGLGTEESERVAAAAQGVKEAVEEEKVVADASAVAAAIANKGAAAAALSGLPENASAARPGASVGVALGALGREQVPTVPVEAGPAAPKKVVANAARTYTAAEVFQFFHNAALRDTLDIGNKGAARWLSLSAPFRIKDPEKPAVEYPTVEHFLAGMKVKLAGGTPELAEALFSRTGTIHQEFVGIELAETGRGKRKLTEDRKYELLAEEREKVRDESVPSALRRQGVTFDASRWATVKEQVLREALTQRFRDDAEFQRIVLAAKAKGKYLLYYSQAADELGGVRKQDGRIEGENRVGKIIMELADF
jgi:predicted NAD-dependent protein-ADP-ribosyltransferase YbiA (DUF1768 family)